jgi:hypothetical protein
MLVSSLLDDATYRFRAGIVEHVRSNVNGLALNLVGPPSIVSEAANNSTNIAPGHGDGFAIVQRFHGSEKVEVLLSQIGKFEHQDGPLLGGNLPPCGFKGLAGSGDGKVDILLRGFANRGNDLFCARVDNLKLLLVNTLNPLVVDEAGGREFVLASGMIVCDSKLKMPAEKRLHLTDMMHLQTNGLLVGPCDWGVELDSESHGGASCC